jgi:glycerophosphoryl diester phosphodiesterase
MINLCAHRGNAGSIILTENAMDNSIEAIGTVLKKPYIESVELDVRKCKDGMVVVHDKNTNGMHKSIHAPIRALTEEELGKTYWHDSNVFYKCKELGALFHSKPMRFIRSTEYKLQSKQPISTIKEMLDFILSTNPNKEVLLDLKENAMDSAIELSKWINQYKSLLNIKVHGYDENMMEEVKERTGVQTGVLVGLFEKRKLQDSYMSSMVFDFMSIPWLLLTKDLVRKFYEYKRGFNVYTVNNIMPLKRLNCILRVLNEEENIDFGRIDVHPQVITNVPDIIYEFLEQEKVKKKTI